jgi:anti-sigma factor RsiW
LKEAAMKCNEIRELMPDLAAGLSAATTEVEQHLSGCSECAAKLMAFRQTMSLLDEWPAPEPSPYFDARLRARLREEGSRQAAGRLQWLHKPALAVSFALLMAVGVTLFQKGGRQPGQNSQPVASVQGAPGTAVGDLQALDKNHELYSDFDLLDDLQVQSNVMANP